jgi:Uma2 family endonuclease
MNDIATKTEYTPEDLLAMPDGDQFELVDGRLVERQRGFLADWVGERLLERLWTSQWRSLGWVLSASYIGPGGAQAPPPALRRPAISFVCFARSPREAPPPVQLAPDLAVEVSTSDDLYEEVDGWIEEYHRAGVRLVWVVSPQNHTVRVYRLNGSSISLREDDHLDGEDVLPGFRCPVRELFPQPRPASADNGDAPVS